MASTPAPFASAGPHPRRCAAVSLADIPLTNDDGETLAAIGPEWVEFMEAYPVMAFDGTFPNLDPKIPIPCSL